MTMKNLLLTAALVLAFAAPSFAEDAAPVAEVTTTVETTAPAVEAPVADEAKTACTTETNEKVKLPENAGDAEKAQWDAAFAECLKGKGVEASTEVKTEVTTDAEAAGDAAVEVKTEETKAAE